MANYKGFFRSLDATSANTAGTLYSVYLEGDTGTTGYTEIALAGDSPFVVQYDTSSTPFEPIRTSTATIQIVNNDYLEDIYSPYAQGTRVTLKNETNNSIEWVGFLTPKLYDQSYQDEYETIQLEAGDCLTSLQYIDYIDSDDTGYTRSIVTIWSMLNKICDACQLLDGYYWTRSKSIGGQILLPTALKISEENFFSSDTDESWNMQEVLTEICRYFGFTAIQFKNRLYLTDYQRLSQTSDIYFSWFSKSNSYAEGSPKHVGTPRTLSQDDVRGAGASISFEPIYNKCKVIANYKTIEYLIPNIFEDNFLTNRMDADNFYENCEYIPPSDYAQYPSKIRVNNPKTKDDGDKDTSYRFFHRYYDNKYWDSVYHEASGADADPSPEWRANTAITRDYMGGTIVDLGCVKKDYLSDYNQWVVPNRLDYTRYLCLACQYRGSNTYWHPHDDPQYTGPFVMFELKPGYHCPCMLSDNAYLVIYFNMIWERYINRPYINPSWCSDECKVAGGAPGMQGHHQGKPIFQLKIGDKYWNGSGWTSANTTFAVTAEKSSENRDIWNTELHTLNNVSWDMFVNEEGYKIPLSGVNMTDEIIFRVMRPGHQFMWNSGSNDFIQVYHYNAYCWLKDLSIKCVEAGRDGEDENDVVYENVIDDDAVNEISDITCKLTTYTEQSQPSYSNVIYYNGVKDSLLTGVTEAAITGSTQKPEENIVQKYVDQYSTPTKKITGTFDYTFTPFDLITNLDVDYPTKKFVQLGTEINYANGSQTITYVEKK